MTDVSIVLVTVGKEEEAREISRTVVQEKLAACVNMISGVRSLYWWKGEVCDDQEWLLIMKTRTSLFPALQERIKALHTYEVPEVIAFRIEEGLPAYLDWVLASTASRAGE